MEATKHKLGVPFKDRLGYIQVSIDRNHPYAGMVNWRERSNQVAVAEHRLIMAKHLGRCLECWEVVHHKNGIKDDNRVENLEVERKGEHTRMHNKGYQDGFNTGYREGLFKASVILVLISSVLLTSQNTVPVQKSGARK